MTLTQPLKPNTPIAVKLANGPYRIQVVNSQVTYPGTVEQHQMTVNTALEPGSYRIWGIELYRCIHPDENV
jgi:hypothetical protein